MVGEAAQGAAVLTSEPGRRRRRRRMSAFTLCLATEPARPTVLPEKGFGDYW